MGAHGRRCARKHGRTRLLNGRTWQEVHNPFRRVLRRSLSGPNLIFDSEIVNQALVVFQFQKLYKGTEQAVDEV